MMQEPSIRAGEPSVSRGPHAPRASNPPHAHKNPTARIVLVVLLLLVVGGTWWLLHTRANADKAQAAAAVKAAADHVTPVLTSRVEQRDVPIWLDGLGNVAAFYTVTVKTQVDGRIDRVLFIEGQKVKKGDVLIQIDPRPFAIQLESAQAALVRDQAQLKNGQLNLDRYKTLSDQNLIAVQQYTDQKATVDQLNGQILADQAGIDSAKLNLDYARITSPIDGVAGLRQVDPGNVVHATDTTGLVVVTQLDPIAVFFTLPEDDLVQIEQAMAEKKLSVEARSRDGDKLLGQGTLAVIDNEINQATATLRLKAIFPNPDNVLWPNQFVKARLKLKTIPKALIVPAAVVQHGPQGTFAYVVAQNQTAEMRPITVDTLQGDNAVIANGLQVGEEVVAEGQAQLRPGAKVSTKPMPAGAASSASAGSSASADGGPHRSKGNAGAPGSGASEAKP
jgi:multidrug efflux system membrane fusion protein